MFTCLPDILEIPVAALLHKHKVRKVYDKAYDNYISSATRGRYFIVFWPELSGQK